MLTKCFLKTCLSIHGLLQIFTIPGVDFTNILWAALTCKDPKSSKWHCWLDCLFALLGSACIKAARKMLVKWIPESENFNQNSVCTIRLYFKVIIKDIQNARNNPLVSWCRFAFQEYLNNFSHFSKHQSSFKVASCKINCFNYWILCLRWKKSEEEIFSWSFVATSYFFMQFFQCIWSTYVGLNN